MKRAPLSKADAARARQVSRAAVTLACRPGGPLVAALLPSGKLDANSEAYKAWLKGDPTGKRQTAKNGQSNQTVPRRPDMKYAGPIDISELLDWTVRQVTDKFGSEAGFEGWLADRKLCADIDRLETANAERKGELIERDRVRAHIIGLIERSHKQLLSDLPRQIVGRLYALGRSGATNDEGIRVIRDAISSILTVARDGVVKNLRKRPAQQRASEATN